MVPEVDGSALARLTGGGQEVWACGGGSTFPLADSADTHQPDTHSWRRVTKRCVKSACTLGKYPREEEKTGSDKLSLWGSHVRVSSPPPLLFLLLQAVNEI